MMRLPQPAHRNACARSAFALYRLALSRFRGKYAQPYAAMPLPLVDSAAVEHPAPSGGDVAEASQMPHGEEQRHGECGPVAAQLGELNLGGNCGSGNAAAAQGSKVVSGGVATSAPRGDGVAHGNGVRLDETQPARRGKGTDVRLLDMLQAWALGQPCEVWPYLDCIPSSPGCHAVAAMHCHKQRRTTRLLTVSLLRSSTDSIARNNVCRALPVSCKRHCPATLTSPRRRSSPAFCGVSSGRAAPTKV
jgi:hypothetical protein